MEENVNITQEQFDNIIKLSGVEYSKDSRESSQEAISRAIIALERRLNYYNYSLSFFIAEATNVLIVDDTELSIFQLSTMLQKIGINVYVARSKEEAYEEFKKKNFDFLIIDIYMPDYTDGFELIKEANRIKNEENRDFSIIAISGTDNPSIIQEAYNLQIDEFIPKAPQWHEKVLKFISNSSNKLANEDFSSFYINDNICLLSVYKINSEKYIETILKEINTNVLTGKKNIILNLEHVKIFSNKYVGLFSEAYKSTNASDGMLILVRPCDDIVKALDDVFMLDAIPSFGSSDEAVDHIEKNQVN